MYNLDEHIGKRKIPKKLKLTGALIIILILFLLLYSLFFIIKYPIDIQCNDMIDEANSRMLLYVNKKYYPRLNVINGGKSIKIYYNKDKTEEKLISGKILGMNVLDNNSIQILIKAENMNFDYSPTELTNITIKNNLISCIISRYR